MVNIGGGHGVAEVAHSWVKLTANFPSDSYVQALLLSSLEEAWESGILLFL